MFFGFIVLRVFLIERRDCCLFWFNEDNEKFEDDDLVNVGVVGWDIVGLKCKLISYDCFFYKYFCGSWVKLFIF